MRVQATPDSASRQEPFRWQHLDCANAFAAFADPFDRPQSQREFARQQGIPPTTLHYWLRRDSHTPEGVDPQLAAFLRSPAGLAFLRRVVLALFLVFFFRGLCGLRAIGLFLELSQLDRFVASSYGACYDLGTRIQDDLLAFEKEERARLAAAMPQRQIVACLDENFHRRTPYLVAIEPASNFILVEEHSPTRDADAWTKALQEATKDLRVQVVLVCSDRAKGLLKCAKEGFEVPHSPDLMHVQREILKPILLPLTSQITKAQKELLKEQETLDYWNKQKEQAQSEPRPRGRPLDYDVRINGVQHAVKHAQNDLEQCQQRLEEASAGIRTLSDLAHPFDPESGAARDAAALEKRLSAPLEQMTQLVDEADLPASADGGLSKGREWVAVVMAVVSWFWLRVEEGLEGMKLPEEAQRAVREQLLPGLYWEQQTRRGRDAGQRKARQDLATRLLGEAWREGGPLSQLPQERRKEVARKTGELAGLFVRSSSCVEGRNGRLSLLQHSHVRLGEQRLKTQTVIHNYLARREDGTTAAERFFNHKQRDLFDWLLQRLPDLPRPAAKRPKKAAAASVPGADPCAN